MRRRGGPRGKNPRVSPQRPLRCILRRADRQPVAPFAQFTRELRDPAHPPFRPQIGCAPAVAASSKLGDGAPHARAEFLPHVEACQMKAKAIGSPAQRAADGPASANPQPEWFAINERSRMSRSALNSLRVRHRESASSRPAAAWFSHVQLQRRVAGEPGVDAGHRQPVRPSPASMRRGYRARRAASAPANPPRTSARCACEAIIPRRARANSSR